MSAAATDRMPAISWDGSGDAPIESALREAFGPLIATQYPQRTPASDRLFARLDEADVRLVLDALRGRLDADAYRTLTEYYPSAAPEHFRREVLRLGTHHAPEVVAAKTGLHDANPPRHIHNMMRKDVFVGDQYSGDLFVEELERCGGRIEPGGSYLDFGCSSGAAVRYLQAAYPEARWSGCDPVPESIAWASEHLAGVDFRVSPQWPPLPYEAAGFDGVYAISIWSHFSERAARAWFDEMARIIRPGGVLMFTTHGVVTLDWALRVGYRTTDQVREIASDLLAGRFRFEDVYAQNDEVRSQLDSVSDWGDAFIPTAWVMLNLLDRWDLVSFRPGRNQSNQDLYLLRRKATA